MNDKYSHAPDEMDDGLAMLQLVTGVVDGEAFWAYMAMRPSGYEEYIIKATLKEPMDLTAFGTVLEKGWGAEPPPEIRQKMKELYEFDDGFESMILDMIEQGEFDQSEIEDGEEG